MVVACVSAPYVQSSWCTNELALAKKAGTEIIPCMIEDVQLPENVRQRIYHWPSVPEVPPEPMPSLRLVPKPLPGED